jgi:benzylsuccinate CoA-transferase BbsE subunit
MEDNRTGPLSHIRVLDLTDEKGQMCGKFLGDLGAEVIKVEPPGGDPARRKGPFINDKPGNDNSLFWLGSNTNKKSITLNLEHPRGSQIFKQLITHVDLMLESFAPGYLAHLSLDYDHLQAENSCLVLTSITPFGQTGPYAHYKAYDLTAVAISGFMFTCGEADRSPVRISIEQAYTAAGVQAASASLLALRFSRLNLQGQHVDVAIRECLPSGGFEIFFWETEGYIGERLGARRRRANVFLRDLWPCKDGYIGWRLLTGNLGAPTIYNLVAWMDSEGMAGDLKEVKWETIDMTQVTTEQMEHWENLFIPFFIKHTKEELYAEALAKAMLMAPAYNAQEILNYKQLFARNFWVQVEYPELQKAIIHPGAFCKMSESPIMSPQAAPGIGEHNAEIYVQILGLSTQELASLKEEGII